MANFSDLPNEIQHLIAKYLPEYVLFKFKSLNRSFLDFWMVLRWQKVELDLRNPGRAKRLLQQIVYVTIGEYTFELNLIVE
jgi:hypothetical protein